MEKTVLLLLPLALVLAYASAQTCDNIVTNPYSRTWLIAVGHDYGAHEYINEGGYIQGFSFDLIKAVCGAAGINCRTVWNAYKRCWDSTEHAHPVGGEGLMSNWFDACASWYTTVDRIHVFDFSMPWLKAPDAYFYAKKGTSFNPNDITGKTIGFLDGWASDEKCVARQTGVIGHFLPAGSVKYFQEPSQFVDAIVNGAVNGGFTTEETMEPYVKKGQITKVSSRSFGCMINGNSMMTRKDNDFIPNWNRGFQKLRNTGDFKRICDQGAKDHVGIGSILCVDT